VSPGDYPRSMALGRAGPQAFVLVLGTVLTLAVAGSIEGFVTGSDLPTAVRVGIGVAVELTFLTWVVLLGRAARARRARDGAGPGSEPTGRLDVEVGVGHQWSQGAREAVDHDGAAGL
jgi:hypothetical protein